ncbi:MAG: hypothetical protein DA408_06095 [Bacteroidetes bacterium]|nr:MAG: hypothetical protein C7N36_14240 [Bacteroidota bacterium]PTM13555.1 MAG: hypothetical protein DA408_06095 [Bacteroidota bacterium]
MELHWSDHLFFVIVGVLIPLRTIFSTQPQLADLRFTTRMKLQLYWGNNLWLWLLAGATAGVWFGNGRPWALIGLDWPWSVPTGWPLVVTLAFMLLYVADTFLEVSRQVKRDPTAENIQTELSFLPQTAYEFFHFIFLALTAGFCEEFIFRGFFVRYFQCLFGYEEATYTLAILVPALIFGLVHLYQGWHAVVKITAMAIMFGYVFVHTNSLWLLIAIHAAVDLIGGAIAWGLSARSKVSADE